MMRRYFISCTAVFLLSSWQLHAQQTVAEAGQELLKREHDLRITMVEKLIGYEELLELSGSELDEALANNREQLDRMQAFTLDAENLLLKTYLARYMERQRLWPAGEQRPVPTDEEIRQLIENRQVTGELARALKTYLDSAGEAYGTPEYKRRRDSWFHAMRAIYRQNPDRFSRKTPDTPNSRWDFAWGLTTRVGNVFVDFCLTSGRYSLNLSAWLLGWDLPYPDTIANLTQSTIAAALFAMGVDNTAVDPDIQIEISKILDEQPNALILLTPEHPGEQFDAGVTSAMSRNSPERFGAFIAVHNIFKKLSFVPTWLLGPYQRFLLRNTPTLFPVGKDVYGNSFKPAVEFDKRTEPSVQPPLQVVKIFPSGYAKGWPGEMERVKSSHEMKMFRPAVEKLMIKPGNDEATPTDYRPVVCLPAYFTKTNGQPHCMHVGPRIPADKVKELAGTPGGYPTVLETFWAQKQLADPRRTTRAALVNWRPYQVALED